METDAELIIRCRAGDARALDALVRRHYKAALRIARRHAALPEDADDLTQEAFVIACERLDQLADPSRFGGWLLTIVRNQARMWHRRRFTQPTLFALDDEPATQAVDRSHAVREAVADAVATLTAEQRDAVRLHYLDGYDYRETALLLDIPVGAVRGRLDRARHTLRKELREMVTAAAYELSARDLDAMRRAATCALDTDEPDRLTLNAVFFDGDGALIGADGHRIFRHTSESLKGVGPVIVHAELGRRLRDDYPNAHKGRVTISNGEAVLRMNGDEVRAPVIEGEYPHWERAVPSEWAFRSVSRAGDWLDALAMVTRLGPLPENRVLIVLSPEDGTIALRGGEKPDGGVAWEVGGSFRAEYPVGRKRLTIAANVVYVEQAIRAIGLQPDDKVEFRANESLKPFMVRPAASDDCWVLTMPMQPA